MKYEAFKVVIKVKKRSKIRDNFKAVPIFHRKIKTVVTISK